MSLEIKVPTVGESITEVTVATWLKNDGDHVEVDEIIAELESDKATFELPAEGAGIIRIVAQQGDTIEIGATICTIDTTAAGSNATAPTTTVSAPATSSEAKSTGEVRDMIVPTVGESITEVTISSWLKEDGDYIELDEIIAEVDSDKATFELPAEGNGILRIVSQEGDVLQIGALICKIEIMEGGVPATAASATHTASSASSSTSENTTYTTGHASPAAAKILAEKAIDASTVNGTGKDGRITKEDAAKVQKSAPTSKTESKPAPPTTETPVFAGGISRNERREKMSSLRRTVAKRLVSVKNETAMLTTFNEVNMKPIMDLRKQYKEQFKEKHGVGLGFMSFFTKACCVALQEWPAVNAKIDGNEMIFNDYCDISIAVSAPKGLVVPIIRNAESLDFKGIESEVIRLATKARDGKLTIDEMMGGTFTLTNGGVFGSMMSTPIINAPQSAILGMHNIVQRAVVVNGEIVAIPMMYLALSYDHRIIDGRESVSFLVRVKQLLEDPTRLLLNV